MNKLKPCPFCGSNNVAIYDNYKTKFTVHYNCVECLKCGAMVVDTNEKHSLNDVVKAWNRRVNDDEQ